MALTTTKISGDLVGVYADGTLIANARDATLSVSQDLISIITKDSGGYEENLHGNRNWEISGSALQVFAASVSISEVIDYIINASSVSIRFKSSNSDDIFYTGSVSVSSASFSAPQNSVASYDFTFTGNGELVNSATAIYTSDFSVDTDIFTIGSNLTLTGNNDSIGGLDDWMKAVLTGGSASHNARSSPLLTITNSYLVTGKAYVPSGNTKVDGISLWDGILRYFIPVSADTVVEFEQEIPSVSVEQFRIWASDGGAETNLDADGDIFYVKDLIVRRIA